MSGAGETEMALLEALCQAAEAAWTGRLREGVAAEDCGTAFPCAAAFTAAADLAAGRSGNTVAAFKAGDVSVESRDGADSAALAGDPAADGGAADGALCPSGGLLSGGCGDDNGLGTAGIGPVWTGSHPAP